MNAFEMKADLIFKGMQLKRFLDSSGIVDGEAIVLLRIVRNYMLANVSSEVIESFRDLERMVDDRTTEVALRLGSLTQ